MFYTTGSTASRRGVLGMNQWNYGMQQPSQGAQATGLPWTTPVQHLPSFPTTFQSNLPVGGLVFARPQTQTTTSSLA